MKTPKQLRREIHDLSAHLSQVQGGLQNRSSIKVASIGKECKRTADLLAQLLKNQQVPSEYKVAVVGRFKAGKSSFVNELLNTQLASEGTLPETAAVTTFKYGSNTKASIGFVDRTKWQQLKVLYAESPKNFDAHRISSWESFSKPKKTKEGEPEKTFDLAGLEQQYVHDGGCIVSLELAADATKKSVTEFRRKLKEFTSANSPLHCLVDRIEITAPAEILDQGVLLIDTPGLDDTERFRVTLTEKVVADVDAVLFLTKSGASYGQSEKEFLLSLLRKGTVKQLIVVVTQIDETYRKILEEAEDNDEEPESIADCIARERTKIAREISDTLSNLGQDDSLYRYQEQLGQVPIAFTSARLHRNWKEKKSLPFVIDATDPGGVEKLKGSLLYLLSTESRLAQAAENLVKGASGSLLELQTVLQTKLKVMQSTQSKEVAEQKLDTFRHEFGQASQRFARAVEQQVKLLTDHLAEQSLRDEILLGYIGVLAEQPLSALESHDMGIHWKTRRNGGWGHLNGLLVGVANAVFPKVQQLLDGYTEQFVQYATQFGTFLDRLAQESDRIAIRLELGATLSLDVSGKLKASLDRSLSHAKRISTSKKNKVVELLHEFVTDGVVDLVADKRFMLEKICEAGTTARQNLEVQSFYREVKSLLKDALNDYLQESCRELGEFFLTAAKAAPRDALSDVQVLLEQAADNILATTAENLANQKEAAVNFINSIDVELQQALDCLQSVNLPSFQHGLAAATGYTLDKTPRL
ncbi:dynamin family protein [Malikia sp.]|uniref:dynamin family protein n=1 Tax=Malikia sp. TaxID=2070706 RepID=UPI002619D2B5|nr:dynamin family protein [Malikia sp.]MDD2728930.1 dynamin family protein [Malikia sp.]